MVKQLISALVLVLMLFVYANSDVLNQAKALVDKKEFAKAELLYNSILLSDSNNVDALLGRGFVRLAMPEQLESALEDFLKVLEKTPSYTDAYYGAILVYKRKGELNKSRSLIEKCFKINKDKKSQMQYLAMICWETGFYPEARRIEKSNALDIFQKNELSYNKIIIEGSYESLTNGGEWKNLKLFMLRQFRPDFKLWLNISPFERYNIADFAAGVGFVYKYAGNCSFEYEYHFSDSSGFLARHYHQPIVSVIFLKSNVLGFGAKFLKYNDAWAKLAKISLEHYFGSINLFYALNVGTDNNSESVLSHVFKLGYDSEELFNLNLGFSYGNESLEKFSSEFINVPVLSIFSSGGIVLNSSWKLGLAFGHELREKLSYRTSCTISLEYIF